jgi:hypothetical protein
MRCIRKLDKCLHQSERFYLHRQPVPNSFRQDRVMNIVERAPYVRQAVSAQKTQSSQIRERSRTKNARYLIERKEAILKKMLPSLNMPITEVSRQESISAQTLYNGHNAAKQQGMPVPGKRATADD